MPIDIDIFHSADPRRYISQSRKQTVDRPAPSRITIRTHLFLNDSSVQALGAGDVDCVDMGVESLLGALLVVTLAGNADTHTVGDALDTALPDLLVQLGVQADVLGALGYLD